MGLRNQDNSEYVLLERKDFIYSVIKSASASLLASGATRLDKTIGGSIHDQNIILIDTLRKEFWLSPRGSQAPFEELDNMFSLSPKWDVLQTDGSTRWLTRVVFVRKPAERLLCITLHAAKHPGQLNLLPDPADYRMTLLQIGKSTVQSLV